MNKEQLDKAMELLEKLKEIEAELSKIAFENKNTNLWHAAIHCHNGVNALEEVS